MTEDKETILNTEDKAIKTSPNSSLQKPLPQRPLPARPTIAKSQEELTENIKKEPNKIVENKTKKEKIKKQKKEKKNKTDTIDKTPEDAKKNLLKKIRLYLIIGLACAIVIGISILITILLVKAKENKPLVMQNESVVEVISFNGQYFLEVPESEETYYYIFELTSNQTPVLIFSRINKINVSEYFSQQTIFTIRYYVQKISNASRSQASLSVEYAPQEQLTTPVLRLNEETNKLEWNYVLNADSYVFYYANEDEILTYEFVAPTDDEDNIGSFMPEFDYGVYNVSIVAKSSNLIFYANSEQSNIIIVNNFKMQEQVFSASYSLSNQTIYIDASNLPEYEHNFAFEIGDQTLYFSPVTKQDNYEINVSGHGVTIFLGDTVTVITLGDGEYLLDSEPKTCVPQN